MKNKIKKTNKLKNLKLRKLNKHQSKVISKHKYIKI